VSAGRLDEALRRPGYLWSRWPWLAAAHLLAGSLLPVVTAAVLAVVWLPWWLALARPPGSWPDPTSLALVVLGVVAGVAVLPPVSVLGAHVERLRARLVDPTPIEAPARGARGPRALYTSTESYRALAHVLVLLVLGSAVRAGLFLLALTAAVAVATPAVVAGEAGPVALGAWQVDDPRTALLVSLAAPPAVVGLAYLAGLAALGEVRMARTLLGPGPAEVSEHLSEVVRSRGRLVDAFDAERRRIERDLHDGAQQHLLTLTMRLGLARAAARPGTPGYGDLVEAHEMAKDLMGELRDFVHNIHPKVLTDRGLPEALRRLVEGSAVPVLLRVELDRRPPPPLESSVYFAVAEAYHNAVRHSGAARIAVEVRGGGGRILVEVRDGGGGGADPGAGTGITGIADRLASVGGTLSVSSPPGGPTVLRMEVPCP
jgi:signal transduction histidine kinase